MAKRTARYVAEVNTIVPPKGDPFLRIGTNMKKIKKLQRQLWKAGCNEK